MKISNFIRFPNFRLKAFTLSYDDGYRQDKRLVAIMNQYGLKGTFNINGGLVDDKCKGHMSMQEAYELYIPSGMEVAMHGYRHLALSKVDTALAIEDIVADRKILENSFGRVIKGMAYAEGAYNDEIIEFLKKIGVDWARIAGQSEKFDLPIDWRKWQGTCHHNNPRLMDLAKEFVEQQIESLYLWNRKLQIFYLFGHSFEFDNDDNWNVIESLAEYVGNREDIWYATNGEIFEYLQATQHLQFSMDGGFVKNPTSTDIYIDYLDKKCVVPAGKTVKTDNGEIF